MNKKNKILLLVLGGVVLLIAAGVFLLVRNLDSLVESAIERYGTEAAGTAVRVQGVTLGLREGRGSIEGLTIANPPEFSDEPIFRLGEITLDLDPRSLTSNLPIVEEIHVGAPNFLYQVNENARTNLGVIKENLKQYAAAHAGRKQKPTDAEGAPPRLLVKKVTIEGGQGILDLTALGGKRQEAQLPPITLTDIGGADGVTPAALGEAVLGALIKRLEQTAARKGVEQAIRGKLGEKGGELEQKLEEKVGPGAGEALKKILGQ